MNADDDVAWRALLNGLAWLYRSEERERRHQGSAYYAARATSPEGQILAGLMYFRGEVEHSAQTDPYTLGLVNAEVWRKENGEWRNTGAIRKIEARVYPPLHAAATKDTHGRDALYRNLVQGKALGIPFAKAISFLEFC